MNMSLEICTIILRIILIILCVGVGIVGIKDTIDSKDESQDGNFIVASFMILFGVAWTIIVGFQIYNLSGN